MVNLDKLVGACYFGIIRKIGCLALLAVLLFACMEQSHAAERVVSVGVYNNSPKVFLDASGKPAGIFIELIEYIAEKEGWRLQYSMGTWAEGLDRLQQGEIDLMPDVAHSTARETFFAFHREPVLSDWFQVYARKNSDIKSIVDLAGKRVAVLERSVQQASFAQLVDGFNLQVTLLTLPDYTTIFSRVAGGDADAAITNRFYGIKHAAQHGLVDTAIIFNPTQLFFAGPHGIDPEIFRAIDEHLGQLKEDPQSLYFTSLQHWTSTEILFTLPDWVRIMGIVGGTILLMSLVGSVLLKRQVDSRTRKLQELNRDMERRIAERTVELASAMKKAQAADHLKSAFLATMSHELRTPLNSIIGFTGILLQGLAGGVNEEQRKQLGMVQTSARHLLALINDVLDISKIEAGQLLLACHSFELRSAIAKAVQLILPAAEKKGLDLHIDIADDVHMVTGDQRRLEQVLLNLLSNGVKFTEKGRVLLTCRAGHDHYRIEVSDTGIGIDPQKIPDLFQPFYQIDNGLARRHEGTGLGLSICRKLLDMMGGTIKVQSSLGAGSTFTVSLPKKKGEAP
jgi:signal transduction histidine kinase